MSGYAIDVQWLRGGQYPWTGYFDVDVMRFPNEVKVPQMGWNIVSNLKSDLFNEVVENEHVYMVHSYYAALCDDTISETDYYLKYSSALAKNNFYGNPIPSGKKWDHGRTDFEEFFIKVVEDGVFHFNRQIKLDTTAIHDFISISYWADGRTMEEVRSTIENSYAFGIYMRKGSKLALLELSPTILSSVTSWIS